MCVCVYVCKWFVGKLWVRRRRREEEEEEADGSTQLKTRTPHKDLGKKQDYH